MERSNLKKYLAARFAVSLSPAYSFRVYCLMTTMIELRSGILS